MSPLLKEVRGKVILSALGVPDTEEGLKIRISLEDVIVAIGNKDKSALDCETSAAFPNHVLVKKSIVDILIMWDFGKPLDDQDDKVLELINKVL